MLVFMIKFVFFFFAVSAQLLSAFHAVCQSPDDSQFYYKAINNIKADYFSAVQEKAHLYNGVEYEYFGRGATGNPFFMVDTFQNGSVFYDGILYEDVPLRLDLVNDVLLIKYLKDNNTVQLIKSKVVYFSMPGHTFIRVDAGVENKSEPQGFCELLYRGKDVLVLARHAKTFKISSNTEANATVFLQNDQYFVYKDDKYASVNSENDLMKVFDDKSGEMKRFVRKNKSAFKKDPGQAITTAAKFYNGSTK